MEILGRWKITALNCTLKLSNTFSYNLTLKKPYYQMHLLSKYEMSMLPKMLWIRGEAVLCINGATLQNAE